MRNTALNKIRLLFILLGLVCPLVFLHAQTPLSGDKSGILSKSGSPYLLTGAVTVPAGQTLIIEPGCRVLMPYNSYFDVNGTLIANGTATDSIYFNRYFSPYYAYGGYFNINSSSVNSSFSYVNIDSLGNNNYNGYLINAASSFSLTNSSIKNYGANALTITRSNVTVNQCLFSSQGAYNALHIALDTISPNIQNCYFNGSDNGRNIYANAGSISYLSNNINAIITPYGSVSQNSQWNAPGLNAYYQMSSGVVVSSSKTLIIQPGCKVLMNYNGYFDINGTLIADGTETDSIYFKRYYSNYYAYGGYFNINLSSSNSSLSYVSMDSLGNNNYNGYFITAAGSLSLTNSSIKNYGATGLTITHSNITVNQCSFSSQGSYNAIQIPSDTISPTIQNSAFYGSDNGRTIYANAGGLSNVTSNNNTVIIPYGNVNQSSQWLPAGPSSTFKLTGSVVINSGKTLMLQPGCRVLMPYYSYFSVNGTLIANGTTSDSIYFTKQQVNGYNYGGYFNINSSSANSSLSYVSMDSLGYYENPITAARSFSITNSVIRNSANRYSINLASDTISPTIQNCTFYGSEDNRTIYANAGSLDNVTNNTNGVISPYGSVNRNSKWQPAGPASVFKLTSSVTISSGKKLTIQPGCKILMAYNGYFDVNGTLTANGTATDSIYFNRYYSTYYSYGGYFNINASSSNSSFSYVSMDSLGNNNYNGYFITAAGSLSLTNSSIRNYGAVGMTITRSNVTVNQCSFSSQGSYNTIQIASDTISPTIQNCNFYGSNDGRTIYANAGCISNVYSNTNALINLFGIVSQTSQWQKPGSSSSYLLTNGVTISTGKTLTIQPGCKILMAYNGYFDVNGTLIANGTAADSIYFSRYYSTYYSYGGYFSINSTSINSSFSYVSMDSLGNNNYNGYFITAAGPLSLTNSSIRNCGANALTITRSSITVNQCSFSSRGSYYAIYISSDTLFPVIQNCAFNGSDNGRTVYTNAANLSNLSNNTNAIIYLNNSTISQDSQWPKPGPNSYYKIGNYLTVNSGKTLTIQPGCRVLMPYYNTFNVDGTLIANGTVSDSIYFTKQQIDGYNYGGYFNITNSSINSSFSYVSIDSLGYNNYPINAARSFSITNSVIRNTNSHYSIYLISDTISPVIQYCTFYGNDDGRVIYANAGSVSNVYSNTNAIVELNGAISQNCIWQKPGNNSKYKISNVSVNALRTLTIQPGCVIETGPYGGLAVYGTLVANGTTADSIYFKGKTVYNYGYGYYYGRGIEINSSSTGSSISFLSTDSVGFLYCDYNCSGLPTISANAPLSISNSSFRNYGNYASLYIKRSDVTVNQCSFSSQGSGRAIDIYLDSIAPTIRNCNFSGSYSARSIYAPANSFSLISNNTNAILLPSSSITSNVVWPKQGSNSYYQLDGDVTVNSGSVLTIEAGNTINFPNNYSSNLSISGTLRAQGTETAPIRLLKLAGNGSGTYGGCVSLNSGSTNNVLTYCTFDKLGNYNNSALVVKTADASLSNLSISNSSYYGIFISGASPTITSSNITSNPYGIYSSSGKPVFNNCNIFANTSYGIYNASGTATDTVDARNCYWGEASGPKHPNLNPLGLGNPVTDKVKFNPWKTQPANGQIVDMGVSTIIKPVTGCSLTAADTVRVKLTNYGNIALANFPVAYRINGGMAVTETVAASLLPGSSQEYTFTQKVNLSTTGTYSIQTYTKVASDSVPGNDTAAITIQHLAGVNAPVNLIPATNAVNIDLPLTLNWGAVADAESYDLYIWKTSTGAPATPTVAGLTQISYAVSTNLLQYGTAYNWKVAAKRANCRAESVPQTFTTRRLPDLVVDSISVPPTVVSENDITIRWRVRNTGPGGTGSTQWYDVVYISDQPTLGVGTDVYIGQYQNFSTLDSGVSYPSGNITYRIPQGWQGNYYVIIKTNFNSSLTEISDTNNRLTSAPINVSLLPPPDLQVTSLVVSPSTAFSEDSITINYTVQNFGTGPTTVSDWYDMAYLTTDTTLNTNTATGLFSYSRSQPLLVNGTYTVTQRVKLPAQIGGTYYVHVLTDRNNTVFEYTKESNNTRRSLPENIILRPAPNLVVSSITVPTDTVATGQNLNVQWTTRNDGAATANPSWYETVYYSNSATFNPATAVAITGLYRYDSIASLNSSPVQQTVQVPNLPGGTYYFFVKTDTYNSVFESTGENDNISAAVGPVPVVNPDLKPVNLTALATAVSEQIFTISWLVRNDIRAGIYNSSWSDNVYLSQDTLLNSDDISLGYQNLNLFMPPGSDYTRQLNVTLPQAISGNYYLLISVGNGLYEKTKANNLLYKAITITLAPWPDLQVSSITVPATDTVGSGLQLQYIIQNSGTGAVLNKNVTDYIYISPVNNVNTGSLTLLGSVSQTRTLNSGGSYTQPINFTIPTSLTAGTYYVIVATDVNNAVYENTGENNNKTISTGIALTSVPAVDLSVTAGQLLSSNVTAGQVASLQYTVRNNSSTVTVISSWTDAVYLSNNPVLDASDILLSTFSVSGPLNAGATYTQTRSVAIPNGVSGNLYLLVQTDRDNVHTDPNRGNNTLSISNASGGTTIVVTVPPPADLIIPSATAPFEATAAQPIKFGFTVKNAGPGITPAASWADHVYLSTNNVLDYGDVQIGLLVHSGALASGAQYSDTLEVTLPANLSGNYIMIVKTDGGNVVYEPNKTNNLAFSPIYIAAQPPSDLVVTQMNVLYMQAALGAPTPFGWKLKNIGSNMASGYVKEALYLSRDTTFDATDVLLGTFSGNINLPPQADVNHAIGVRIRGVLPGYYHLLVKTDILNNIVEQNEGNNTYVSPNTILISVNELPIDTMVYNVLENNLATNYQIVVPASLAGETMSVKLTGDSTHNAINRLYISYGKLPNSNDYDYVAAVPFQANQEAIIPELKAGIYYLAAYGSDTADPFQTVRFLARIIPFNISSVNATQGGNGGAVTIQINGAKFEPSMTVQLMGANTITAQAVYYVNSTRLYATFNLSGATLGSYTVKLIKGLGTTAQLPNGFAVVPASPGGNGLSGGGVFTCSIQNIGYESNIETDVLAPASVRAGALVKITIAYANNGNVDILVPKRMLLSLGGAPLNFAPYFDQNLQQLLLVFNEADGPPDILRAGASGFIHIYTRALASLSSLSFTVTE